MNIDLNSFQKAITKLTTNSRLLSHADPNQQDTKEAFEDACIQVFECTYELSHKTIKRCLEQIESSTEEIDKLSFLDLIRKGAEKGLLLHTWDVWSDYRLALNKTSHAYDGDASKDVLKVIPDFLEEAVFLLDQISNRNVSCQRSTDKGQRYRVCRYILQSSFAV